MIYFNNVSKIYSNGYKALQNIDFCLFPGELVFISGHSGAGKSTFLKLILGIELLSSGSILFNGYDISCLKKHEIPFLRRQIGSIFHDNGLLLNMTVYDNVAIPKLILGLSNKNVRHCVLSALDKVGMLNKVKKYPSELSICEKQYVCIARAIVSKPLLLLADEPTCYLSYECSKSVIHLFEEFSKEGISVLFTSYDNSLIKFGNFRVVTLNKGCVIED
ncbi:Cell division ATP-binding protein FtsE [Candidatus Providencia siddallii]|uniref:Cell division ATP-binding protein FtsE n=1 Tax=Candidatus Providencia siddallii TaxID=1715285 RepID=A0A0M6W8N7_9GAMM|nr:Cell division ATP-binding protein FtsE [Candidatus Providencia siddallii]